MDTIRGSALIKLEELLEERDVSLRSILNHHNIPIDTVGDYEKRFSYKSLVQLLQTTALACGMPNIGMELATRQGLKMTGPLNYLARSSATVGDGIELALRYMSAYSPSIRYRLERKWSSDSALLCFESTLPSLHEVPQIVEKSILHGVLTVSELQGAMYTPRTVLFRHSAQASLTQYQSYFGCPVQFNQNLNAVVFRRNDLVRSCIHHDPLLQTMVCYYLESQIETGTSLSDEVLRLMHTLLPQRRCNLEQVALALGVSTRTLQRHLAKSGLDFEQQLDMLRRQLAKHLLANAKLNVVQIAGELGYRSATSFCRAHNRWYGMTPQQHRHLLNAG